MHGLGNDYIYVDCTDGTFGGEDSTILTDDKRLADISVRLSDRHTGIGGDGIIMILPSEIADFKMRIFNADGSEGKMCGNGSRCVGKYVYDNGLTDNTFVALETLSGVKYLELVTGADGKVTEATVDMGEPEVVPSRIPVIVEEGQTNVDIPFDVDGEVIRLTAVSMGNPHGVAFVDSLDRVDVHATGRKLETHPAFPDRANIEFVEVLGPSEVRMRVWERGSGETMACGTGACATAVATIITGRSGGNREITVHLLGGDLRIRYDAVSNHVFMQGPATTVFAGEVDI